MRVVLKNLRAAEGLRANAQASQDCAGERIARRPRGLAAKCVCVPRSAGRARIGIDAQMKPLKKLDLPLHARGFRSSFSDWAHERTNFATSRPSLAHTVGNRSSGPTARRFQPQAAGADGCVRRGTSRPRRRRPARSCLCARWPLGGPWPVPVGPYVKGESTNAE